MNSKKEEVTLARFYITYINYIQDFITITIKCSSDFSVELISWSGSYSGADLLILCYQINSEMFHNSLKISLLHLWMLISLQQDFKLACVNKLHILSVKANCCQLPRKQILGGVMHHLPTKSLWKRP